MERRQLESKFYFGDKVNVSLQTNATPIQGEIVGISFTESKVFYDIDAENALLIRIDSALVDDPVPELQPQ